MQLKFDWLIVLENLHRGIMDAEATEFFAILKQRKSAPRSG